MIELMIVVAIIGILAAVAIPAYQDYTGRAQVTEALGMLSGGKAPLSEYYSDRGTWPSAAGSVMNSIGPGKYVSIIQISTPTVGGTLTLQATLKGSGVNSGIVGGTITLQTRNGGKSWDCSLSQAGGGGNIAGRYRPSACR